MQDLTPLFARSDRSLLPDQNVALHKIGRNQGGFLQLLPGTGKTEILALAPWMIEGCKRPLVLMPGGLLPEFLKKEPNLRRWWHLHPNCVWESYQKISHPNGVDYLERMKPDAIFCDEARILGKIGTQDDRKDSAIAGRVLDYVERFRVPIVVADGSFYTRSATRYLHLAYWATVNSPQGAIVPKARASHEAIAAAVDAHGSRGAALKLRGLFGKDCDSPEKARGYLRDRLLTHDAVMISTERFGGAALEIKVHRVRHCAAIAEAFARLRTYEELPDGWSLGEGMGEVAMAARQLSWGYYYVWDPRPSEAFYAARKAWTKRFNKEIRSGRCDTEGTAKILLAGCKELVAWEAERLAYAGQQKAVSIGVADSPIEDVIEWGERVGGRGLIWTGDFLELGERIASRTGWRFYGAGGLDWNGVRIQDHQAEWGPALVSTAANYQGRDGLQYLFDEQLILDPPASGARWDQLLARLLRYGRTASAKTTVLLACKENLQALHSALQSAKAIQSQLSPQLLLSVDFDVPPLKNYGFGPVWRS